MIQIHRLEGFYRVAVAGGYTRAAKSFPYPITQPGVHQQVRRLEDDVGARLFTRASRDRVVLTPEGEALFEFCAPFFETLPRVLERIRKGSHGGTIRVDAPALEIRYLLPPWLRRLRKAHPSIQVDLEEIHAVDLTRLATGKSDLVIDFVPTIPPEFGSRIVGHHWTFLVLPRDPSWATRGPLERILRDKPFISFHPSMPHARMQFEALATVTQPKKVLSASSTEAILGFVAAGLGYSLIPWPLEKGPSVAGVVVRRMRQAGSVFPISAVWRKVARENDLLRAFVEQA